MGHILHVALENVLRATMIFLTVVAVRFVTNKSVYTRIVKQALGARAYMYPAWDISPHSM